MLSKNNVINGLLIIILLILGSSLRITNLGYSEFQDDEKKAIIRVEKPNSTIDFLMNQRKGPMQFLVTSGVLAFNQDKRNEIALRLPFTIFNLISIAVFYLILTELTKSKVVAFFGSLLFLTNGFIVGFSRIAQYQNLNILFSLLSLYFFILLQKKEDNLRRYALLGTISFGISFLSHWDAIFITIPLIYFYTMFLKRKDIEKKEKIYITKIILSVGCSILIFLIPYIWTQITNTGNVEYFDRRVGLSSYPWNKHKFIFELYNPYLTLYLLPLLAVFSLFFIKRTWIYILWFIINLLSIKYFMEKPGTHIYNYVIPLIFLTSFGISALYKFKWLFYTLIFLPLSGAIVFLFIQSHTLFVDHSREYPWEEKTILKYDSILGSFDLKTNVYTEKEVLTFGFPHFRNWKDINNFLNSSPDKCRYITNEGKEISQIYLDINYGLIPEMPCYYIIDVKRPFITRGNGVVFAKAMGKDPIYKYKKGDETLVKVYKILGNKY